MAVDPGKLTIQVDGTEIAASLILRALLVEAGGPLTISLSSLRKAQDYDLSVVNSGECLREVRLVEREDT